MSMRTLHRTCICGEKDRMAETKKYLLRALSR
jgi:hypothetical protein